MIGKIVALAALGVVTAAEFLPGALAMAGEEGITPSRKSRKVRGVKVQFPAIEIVGEQLRSRTLET